MRTISSVHKLLAVLGLAASVSAHAGTTSFSYQGSLAQGTNATSGKFDFRFTLYDAPLVGSAVTDAVTNTAVNVDNGIFTTIIDFGPGVFTGDDRWLEIAVRTNGPGAFTTLTPRQAVTPVPSALFSVNAANYSGPVSASQLSGAIPSSLLPAGLLTNNAAGVSLSGAFAGNGAGLTGLNANSVTGNFSGASYLAPMSTSYGATELAGSYSYDIYYGGGFVDYLTNSFIATNIACSGVEMVQMWRQYFGFFSVTASTASTFTPPCRFARTR